jgi:transcription elongation GreA/GreB family factor
MNSLIILKEADESCLHSILQHQTKPPFPDPAQTEILRRILNNVRIGNTQAILQRHAGFQDRVTLVSPLDSRDFFKFHIVMPHENDIDRERISVCTPIAAAVLGRGIGDLIQWFIPGGQRQMRLIAIEKSDSDTTACINK